jgi:hypothetical protein
VRARLLAIVYVVLGAALAAALGEAPKGALGRYLLVFGLPALVAFLALAVLGAGAWRRRPDRPSRPGWARLLVLAGMVVACDLAPIGLGYLLGWVTFTYGDQRLEATKFWLPIWLPVCLAAGIWGWELGLHQGLYRAWAARGRAWVAGGVSVLAGLALALAFVLPGLTIPDPAFAAAALATAGAREVVFLLFYRASGLLVAGLLRGLLLFVDAFVINDWFGAFFPMANYVSSDPIFYLLRAGGPLVGVAVVAWALAPRVA